jgi:hypothetical protein
MAYFVEKLRIRLPGEFRPKRITAETASRNATGRGAEALS